MKLNKLDGIRFMQAFHIPTITFIPIASIKDGTYPMTKPLSIRTSPKSRQNKRNVNLPSIHHCTDRNKIKDFIAIQEKEYEVFAHETVKPEVIGSASFLTRQTGSRLILETYQDFAARKEEKIQNRIVIPYEGGHFIIPRLTMEKQDKQDFRNFIKVIRYLTGLPFPDYDMEYIIQDGKVLFTDLTMEHIQNDNMIQVLQKILAEEEQER